MHIHTDYDCVTCRFAEEKKKGGRAKKLKRGRQRFRTTEQTPTAADHQRQETALSLTRKVEDREMDSLISYQMAADVEFSQEVKQDFYCPVCKDILFKPAETLCEHYFCEECFKQALQSLGFPLDCPVCRTALAQQTT